MEKIFTVTPGGDPGVIALKVSGVDKLTVNEKGELELVTSLGIVKLTTPVAYQIIDGQRVAVDIAYEVNGDSYGFKVGDYNYAYPLVIDPLLASTYLGGSSSEYGTAVAVREGNVYVAGYSNSTDYPVTSGVYQGTKPGGNDAFIAELTGDLLLHSGPADNEAPTWPDGSTLTESNVNQTSLTLTWTAATDNVGVTGYRIYKNNVLLGSTNATTFTYNVTGLNGAIYAFKVEAGDEYGNWSTTGPSVTVVTPDQTPPTFSSPVLTASNITGTSLTLTWYPALDNVGLTQFQILQNETDVASVYDGTATSYNITGLTPGAQYTFQVKAGDAATGAAPTPLP